jgi:hypothetical protein
MSDPVQAEHGFIRLRSQSAVAASADRLESLLKARGILVFARIDFSGDAAREQASAG